MDAPVSLVPKEARRGGTGTAWKVFARHQEVADPSLVLLRIKNSIPGTIGYAQISDAATYPNVERVKLDGADPDIGAVESGGYPFWTVEYLYTYGPP
jgi:hypothetical protein